MQDDLAQAPAMLNIFNGEMQPFKGQVTVTIHNGMDVRLMRFDRRGPSVPIRVPFHDGPGDFYAVAVSTNGYRDAGCFFKADSKILAQPTLLLLRVSPSVEFLSWPEFKTDHPRSATFLMTGGNEQSAQAHYEELAKNKPKALACLLNLTYAMSEIDLGGRSPLSFFKAICWDDSMAQDRFFGYVDPQIILLVRDAAAKRAFAEEVNCGDFHPGATCSWKQSAFPIADIQLTFHERDTMQIDGVNCVKIEPDIDLYKDLLAHGFLEVFPNLLEHKLTNPFAVFSMRWSISTGIGGQAFDPGYGLV